jgi:hypothetical protein
LLGDRTNVKRWVLANFKRWKIVDGRLGDITFHSILSTNLQVTVSALNNFDVLSAIQLRLDVETIQGIIDPDLVSVGIALKDCGIRRRSSR